MENNNSQERILDLSGKKLKKLGKPSGDESLAVTLILDDNELQRLDNVDCYTKAQKLSAVRNQLLRMYGVCRLHLLHTLNLAYNSILTIEGLKEIVNLKCLCLAGNNIKTIEHLNANVKLEQLDLSENSITHVSDLSFLKSLKELLLSRNKIGHLRQCDRFLPPSLTTLTLARNCVSDLNEISQLAHLTNLKTFAFANNPCVEMTGNRIGFDYRPFVLNWCMSLTLIDGYIVDAIESLRAEWLYSQGRGRHFRIGDHQELSEYLASVCPLTGEALETEEDRKLRLILSKAQHHQQQLRNQESNSETSTPSPSSRKKINLARSSPRLSSSRLSNRIKSPDRMSTSSYSNSTVINSPLMTQSLDPTLLSGTLSSKSDLSNSMSERHQNGIVEDVSSPLQALSKLVPVPESLMSPDYRPQSITRIVSAPTTLNHTTKLNQTVRTPRTSRIATVKTKIAESKKSGSPLQQRKTNKETPHSKAVLKKSPSSEDDSEICASKLQTIRLKAEEKRRDESASSSGGEDKTEQAATCIQKMWRGYHTRNKNKHVLELLKNLETQRSNQYIQKLASDMESTKVALESERRIQMLQMQAINALWKKVSTLQPETENSLNLIENKDTVKDLAVTCNVLQSQIQQLQGSMQDIIKCMTNLTQNSGSHMKENAIATQTEISAVHTPQGEAAKLFPFQKQQTRPSSLPLPVSQRKPSIPQGTLTNQELKQFAGSLVDGVIKTVSETTNAELGSGDSLTERLD